MCDQASALNLQGFVHLQDFLDLENCAQLTEELKLLIAKGATQNDAQCPKSEAVHGAVAFDSLLEQLLPNFEYVAGRKLYPTYAYARLYKKGEELKIHTDREACEFTATITLGCEGTPWPIFIGDYTDSREVVNTVKTTMAVGDAVFFKGMVKPHWREEFEGEWQAQVFLHYVDAAGPYADQKYDKREMLTHHRIEEPDAAFRFLEAALTVDACRKIIEGVEKVEGEAAQIGSKVGVVDKRIRDVTRTSLDLNKGIAATLAGIGMQANHEAWGFHVTHTNQSDFLRYDNQGHYTSHVDTFLRKNDAECRKVTVLLFLNDDFEGGRLYLQNGPEKIYPPQSAGTVLAFPSFILHGVEPVTAGVRRSIVTWLVGPTFK